MTFSKTLFEELFGLTLAILLFGLVRLIANMIEDSQRELFFKVIREDVKIYVHNLI